MLVGQIPAVMWAIDRDLRFLSSQGSALELLGLEPDGVVGMTLYDYFGTEDPDYLPIAQHYRALSGESVVYDFEWEGHSFQCLCAPRFDTAGRITGALGVAVVSEWSGMTLGETPEEVITAGPLRLMVDSYSAELGDRALKLTPTEFKLLQEFARNQGVVLSRDVLLKQVWGYEFLGGSRVVDMAVKRLRDKLEEQSGGALVVETVRGVGYKLEV